MTTATRPEAEAYRVPCYYCQLGKGVAIFEVDDSNQKQIDTSQPIRCDSCGGDFLVKPIIRLEGECPHCKVADRREIDLSSGKARTFERIKHRPCASCGKAMVREIKIQLTSAPYRPGEPFGRRAFHGRT